MTSTINHLFAIGLFCTLIGVLVMLDEFLLRVFTGLVFFFLAYIVLFVAYKLQGIRDVICKFGSIAHPHECATCTPKKKRK